MVSPRRRLAWADTRLTTTLGSASGTLISNLLTNAPTVDTLTVNRIIVDLRVFQSPVGDTEQAQVIDLGIGVSSTEAFNIGASALSAPFNDNEYPPRGWLYVATAVALQARPTNEGIWRQDAVFKADLRAMRKIDKGILFLFMRNVNFQGTDGAVSVVGRIRALCLT